MRETRDPEKPDIVFHYNRERRLEHAPESVRKAYEQGQPQRHGLIRGLTATPGLRSIFFVIVLLSVIVIGLSLFGTPRGYAKIGTVPVQLKAFLFDEQVYVSLTCMESAPDAPVPIRAVLEILDGDGIVVDSREMNARYTGEKLVLRNVFTDHDIRTVRATLVSGNSTATTAVSVDRK